MNAREREEKRTKETESLLCDSKRCLVLSNGVWKERFEDLVFGVGP